MIDLKKFQEQIFFATVRISIRDHGGAESIGTGFLFTADLDARRSVTLLVSNKHVYGDPSRNIELNFHQIDSANPTLPELGKVVTLQAKAFKAAYEEHPDPDVDLACLNVSAITEAKRRIFYKTIGMSHLADFAHPDLLPGHDVWFIGYPENRYDTAHNLPILRRGHIASIPKVDFNLKSQLVIDAQVFPGSSGSPVFSVLGDQFKLVGVITQTMIRHAQLQAVPVGAAIGVQEVIGLGIALKSPLVKGLVDCVVEKIRKELENKQPEPISQETTDSTTTDAT